MRYVLFGDVHGRDLGDLEKAVEPVNPDVLVCTSDFDQVKSVRQFMDWEKRFKEARKDAYVVPGNHDHAVLYNEAIQSGALKFQGRTINGLHKDLLKDEKAYEYMKKLIDGEGSTRIKIYLDEKRFGRDYRTMIIHGALGGDLSSYDECPDSLKDLWMRLLYNYDFVDNFERMEKEKCKVMFRGHDHEPSYVCYDHIKGLVFFVPQVGDKYELSKEDQHVIAPGAWFDRKYALIDTDVEGVDVPVVEFCGV